MRVNISTKNTGDSLNASEFNQVISAINDISDSPAQISGMTSEVNGISVNPPAGFNPVNNNSVFVEINNVAVGAHGGLDIYG